MRPRPTHLTVRSTDGTVIAFKRYGTVGVPLVLVHGAGSDATVWHPTLPWFTQIGPTITIDRRGRGASGDHPRHSLHQEIDDLLSVLRRVDEPVHLIAHSYGAVVALGAAARRRAAIRTLTVYEPPLGVDHLDLDAIAEAEQLLLDGQVAAGAVVFLKRLAAITQREIAILERNDAVWGRVLDSIRTAPREARSLLDVKTREGLQVSPDLPSLYLVGELTRSPIYLDPDTRVRLSGPNWRRALLDGQGHLAVAFNPGDFARLVIGHLGGMADGSADDRA